MKQKPSIILRITILAIAFVIIAYGILIILGGHITPGGGFQGGAMIASALILTLLVYGVKNNPFNISHSFINVVENVSALGYVLLGIIGLFTSGFFLYNMGADVYNIVPSIIQAIFHYPDTTNAGIIPYLNIFIGLKVLVGLTTVAIAFYSFDKLESDH
ncbi:MnhB domain-containing protein [Methanobrevibacter sp. DSM 116169]|uniref:MnhB domain-containing protein n=1 Tax=Methanobrevibacter sp. DSM 116169 TaxID=3242727 RepID=UPI0038FCEFFE